jgi:hypothetical protein
MFELSSFIKNKYVISIISAGLVTWIVLIFLGMIYITHKIINDYEIIKCPKIDEKNTNPKEGSTINYVRLYPESEYETHEVIKFSDTQERLSKMAIIMFWILFLPLSVCGILFIIKKI